MSLRSGKIRFCTFHFTCNCWDILSSQGQSVLHHLFLNFTCLFFLSGCQFPLPMLSCPIPSPQVTQSQCILAFPSGKCAIFYQRYTHCRILLFHSLLFFWIILRKVYSEEIFCIVFLWLEKLAYRFVDISGMTLLKLG